MAQLNRTTTAITTHDQPADRRESGEIRTTVYINALEIGYVETSKKRVFASATTRPMTGANTWTVIADCATRNEAIMALLDHHGITL